MNKKKIITGILIVFLVVSFGYAVVREAGNRADMKAREGSNVYKSLADKPGEVGLDEKYGGDVDIVCYFMNNQRCSNCYKIETYTREAVETNFTDNLKNGKLIWEIVNVDIPENRHFIKDYELYTKSVVLVKLRDGKQVEWKNLDMVWSLLNDKDSFQSYITGEVTAFLGEG